MTTQKTLLILGAGIAGLSAALALAKIGRHSLVIEQADEFKEIGAGIQVGPNGFRALASMGVAEDALSLAVLPDDLIFMDSVTSQPITQVPVGAEFKKRFGYPYTLIHRADLHQTLLRACQATGLVDFRNGTKVTGLRDLGRHVEVSAASGETFEGIALIGADGLWSATRQHLIGDGAPRVSGHIAYRAVLPTEEVPERYRRNAMMLWGGPKNHLVQYPLRGGELYNLVAVFHSDRYVEGWNTEGDSEELQRRFEGTCEAVQMLLSKISSWRMWVLCDREPVKNWSRGRITLMGDAAHPMLQYLAQGACMAIEDAVVLAEEVQAAGEDVAGAFQRYQQRRYLRTGRCQLMARVHGEFYHAEGVSAELRNAMLSARTPQQSYDGLAWLYEAAA